MKMKQILAGVLTAAMVLTSAPVTGLNALAAADSTAAVNDVRSTVTTWFNYTGGTFDGENYPERTTEYDQGMLNQNNGTIRIRYKLDASYVDSTEWVSLVSLDGSNNSLAIYVKILPSQNKVVFRLGSKEVGTVAKVYDGTSGNNGFNGKAVDINNTDWHTIEASVSSTSGVSIYVDGGCAGNTSTYKKFTSTLTSNPLISIGKTGIAAFDTDTYAGAKHFKGKIDFLTITGEALLYSNKDENAQRYADSETAIAAKQEELTSSLNTTFESATAGLNQEDYTAASWAALQSAFPTGTENVGDMLTSEVERLTAMINDPASFLVEKPKFTGMSITLGGKIGVNFYTNMTDATGATAEFKRNNDTTIEAVSEVENGVVVYRCEVSAKEMTDMISATLTDAEGNTATATQSVSGYAATILNDTEKYANEQDLVKAMLNYGAAAQTKFTYRTDSLANAALGDTDKEVSPIGDQLNTMCTGHGVNDVEGYKGFSLVLKSETDMKLYFNGDMKQNISAVSTADATKVIQADEKLNNTFCSLTIADVPVNHLDDTYTVKVGDTSVGTVCPLTYCWKVASNSSAYTEELNNLVNALYAYYQAAEAYTPQ